MLSDTNTETGRRSTEGFGVKSRSKTAVDAKFPIHENGSCLVAFLIIIYIKRLITAVVIATQSAGCATKIFLTNTKWNHKTMGQLDDPWKIFLRAVQFGSPRFQLCLNFDNSSCVAENQPVWSKLVLNQLI